MDVLKDITDGLRRGSESGSEESGRDEQDTRARRDGRARSTTAESAESADSNESAEPAESADSAGSDPEDVHLCSFCETEFDAGRDTCPECDAEIVLRGAR